MEYREITGKKLSKDEIALRKKVRKEIEDISAKTDLAGKKIYAMGGLPNADILDDIIYDYQSKIEAVVDNNREKAGQHIYGAKTFTIVTPETFWSQNREEVVLLIFSFRFWSEMREQMIRKGYVEGKNLFVINMLTAEKKLTFIKAGVKLLQSFEEKYGEDVFIFLLHGPIGDNFLFYSFLPYYVQREDIKNPLCIGTELSGRIHRLFGLYNFEEVTKEQIFSLEYLYMFLGNGNHKFKILQIWEFDFHFNRCWIRFRPGFTFMDTFRKYVYALEDKTLPCLPAFAECGQQVKEHFGRLGLHPGLTVIIAPFAYSIVAQPPKIFWQVLVSRLREAGYDVAVNARTEYETNFLPDVPVMSYELSDSLAYLEYAGAFVSMRSGFCDVTSKAKCHKVILYPEYEGIDYERHRSDIHFGGLKNMGLCDDAWELEYRYYEGIEAEKDYWEGFAEQIVAGLSKDNKVVR